MINEHTIIIKKKTKQKQYCIQQQRITDKKLTLHCVLTLIHRITLQHVLMIILKRITILFLFD